MKDKIKLFFESDWTMTEKILLLADILLFGVLFGWLTSPLRDGFHFFSDNCYDAAGLCCDCEDDEDEEE